MRECTVCGETDFEEHEGHYFCSTCNTQSQDVRVIVAEEENFNNFRRTGLIREAATPKQSKKKLSDHGRPWSVYEAYQIIIQHQVDALIKLGAQESLRDVVFQIWVNYLSRLGVAFSSSTVNDVKYERQRELFPSTTDKPKIKNVLGKKSRNKTVGPSATKVQKQMERDKTIEALQNEEFYKKDNPIYDFEENEADSKTAEWSSGDEDDKEQRWGRYRKSLKYNAVQKVRMTSTVAVCFLGLMHTNPLTTATDLLRWIRSKKIPCIDVRPIIPDDMKFYLNDWKLFGLGSSPTLDQIRQTAGTIAYYIGLRNFPEFPLDDLINKYMIRLDLPAELHGLAINVFKCMQIYLHYVPSANQKMTIYWEGIAMAYIIVMLKLVFGFNDSNEILMSEYSKELSEISECAKPLFVWTDWVQHMKNRMQIEEQKRSKTADKKLGTLGRRVDMVEYKTRERIYKKAFRESLARPLFELSKRWKEAASDETQSPTRDVLFHEKRHEAAPIDFDVNTLEEVDDPQEIMQLDSWSNQMVPEDEHSKVSKDIGLKSDHFRKSTVQHMLSPETYLTDIQNRIETSSQQQRGAKGRSDFSISEMIINDFYKGSKTPVKRKKIDHSSQTGSQGNLDVLDEEESAMNDRIEKYQAVIEKLNDMRKNVETSLDFETKEICLSYDWLLKICCSELQCEREQLRNMICKLEIMYFSEPDDESLSKAGKLHRKKMRTNPQYFANTILRM